MQKEAQDELFEEDTVEVEVEKEEKPQEESVEAEVVEEQAKASDDELESYSESVQKRISKLTAKMREAERREKAALEYAQSVQKQLDDSSKKTQSLDESFVTEFENRVAYQEQSLRNGLREAIDRGDIDAQVEAQTALAKLAQDNERLAYVKRQREAQAQQVAEQPQVAQPQAPAQIDPKAQAWADKNEWFGTDEPMTLTAFSIHKSLIETEGFDPQSDEYYQELDTRIRSEFPHKFGAKQARSSGPVVAGANRNAQRSNKKSVKLTESQVAIARKLGITNEQYARQLLRLQES
tara:strand:- start:4015 stop:4896 length:882 start_codon:yes stop_codon:yes gene_type:complete